VFGGPIGERAAQRGLLHADPVPAVEGGKAMTRGEVLDAIEARLALRLLDEAEERAPHVDAIAETRRPLPRFLALGAAL
jgi:hypothetical protein